MREYLLTLLVAAAVTYLTAGLVRAFAVRWGVFAEIRDRDVHDTLTPRLGGVAMYLGLAAALLVAGKLPLLRSVFEGSDEVRALMTGATLICLLGAADDKWGLDALTKMAGQAVAAGVMALQGLVLLWLPWPGQTIALDPVTGTLLTILIVVGVVNAINFVDGLDGLAAGIVAIAASAFFVFSYLLSVENASDRALTPSLISAVIVGVCLGFLLHNFNPALIFMGDAGSMLLGLLLAASTIALTGRVDYRAFSSTDLAPALLPLLLPLAAISLPFIDVLLAVVRRTRARRSPFAPDKRHLHHRLLEIGHSHRRAVELMYAWTFVLAYGVLALALLPLGVALTLCAAGFAGLVLFVRWPRVRARLAAAAARD